MGHTCTPFLPHICRTGIAMENGTKSKQKITNKLASSLKPKEAMYRVYDSVIHGFVARVQPTGKPI